MITFHGGGMAPHLPPGLMGIIVALAVIVLIVILVKYVLDN